MLPLPPSSPRPDTLFPSTALFRALHSFAPHPTTCSAAQLTSGVVHTCWLSTWLAHQERLQWHLKIGDALFPFRVFVAWCRGGCDRLDCFLNSTYRVLDRKSTRLKSSH